MLTRSRLALFTKLREIVGEMLELSGDRRREQGPDGGEDQQDHEVAEDDREPTRRGLLELPGQRVEDQRDHRCRRSRPPAAVPSPGPAPRRRGAPAAAAPAGSSGGPSRSPQAAAGRSAPLRAPVAEHPDPSAALQAPPAEPRCPPFRYPRERPLPESMRICATESGSCSWAMSSAALAGARCWPFCRACVSASDRLRGRQR